MRYNVVDHKKNGISVGGFSYYSSVLSDEESVTYEYYHKNIKPKPEAKKKGYVCKVCGWVYEGDTLPDDITCPICKHGAADFKPTE